MKNIHTSEKFPKNAFNNFCLIVVVTALISNGDEDTAEGRLRTNALNALCEMNPGQALATRTLCVEIARMPSLMLKLSLKEPNDLVRASLFVIFLPPD